MNLTRDFRSYPWFVKLVKLCDGEEHAVNKFMALYAQLDFQAEMHGIAGYFRQEHVQDFEADNGMSFASFVGSGVLIEVQDGYYCPYFASNNPESDSTYIEVTKGDAIGFARTVRKAVQGAPKIGALLEAIEFKNPDGHRLQASELNRCLVLIKTLDGMLLLGERPAERYTAELVQDAFRAVSAHSLERLDEILKRIQAVRQRGGATPASTELVLHRFARIVKSIMPADIGDRLETEKV
jgi:hypothetical protein